jgi:CubicO group peptidase (beta-lactamase class C family)
MVNRAALISAILLCSCSTTGAPTAEPPARDAAARFDSARVDAALRRFVDEGALAGVSALVYKDGREVYFGAFGMADREAQRPMARDTIAQIYSMTKPVTGVALMTLYDEGRFRLDDPLSRYAPEFANLRVYQGQDASGAPILAAPGREITIRDLMRHTSGFVASADDSGAGLLFRSADPMNMQNTLTQMAERLGHVPLLHEPGQRWVYGPSVDVQAFLVERLSGKKFDDYLRERIFAPLRMRDTGFTVSDQGRSRLAAMYRIEDSGALVRVPDAEGQSLATRDWPMKPGGFGLVSTLDDYARFARMLLNEGELDGVRILRPETVRLMATDHLPADVTDRSWLPSKGQVGFGLDFAVRIAPPANADEGAGAVGEFFWDGLANTLFWVDPQNGIVAVLFTQYLPPQRLPLHKRFRDVVYAAVSPEHSGAH